MDKIIPDPPFNRFDASSDHAQKYAAYKRALDHYLSPTPSPDTVEPMLFTVAPETSFESALVHASSLLCCASATAQEADERLDGTSQTLVISVLHLVDMARALVDRAVECVEPR
ncbi:DUF3077 domain-containing protein [Pseudomonas fluorescens]|uniref:DUF6124 family protein n=1 Tax=Pseudomonas fluorescens TaxID=294 RepID=UPI0021CF351C|nr:DUF3077 domain-containing protein [Pseudomonas fluorescens]UXV22127.1 DUF3077 domain-containing protein [Pseudomonas fluorescens]